MVAEGAVAAGAEFANIAVLDAGATTAHLYNASSLSDDVAPRYPAVAVDGSSPLGAVLSSGGEIWLPSLSDAGIRYPPLREDAIEAGLASTASLALRDQHQSLIGAMGVAWARAQAFTDAQKDEVRVVAQLAGDALGRAHLLAAERAARQRTERLQQMMSALVASASLAEVTASVFEHGLLPFGASAARLVLVDQRQPERLVTVNAVGLPEPLLAQWQAYPLSDASPSRRALETSAIVYVPTAADLAAEYPDASIGQRISGQQAWVAVPLRSGGRTLGVLTLVFSRACLAGHPPPLLRGPDGTVRLLDEATGVLLGLETHNRPEEVVTFAPGSSVVLFTDGLVERRDETFDTGIARLAIALKAALPPDPASLCDALVEQSVPYNDRDDDIAILSAYLA